MNATSGTIPDPLIGSITRLLRETQQGDCQARNQLLERVYSEMHQLADERLRPVNDELLQPTALAHAACERLLVRDCWTATDRAELFRIIGCAVRDTFVEHVRRVCAEKRGGKHRRVQLLDQAGEGISMPDLLDLDDALQALGQVDPPGAEIVQLRFYSGCTLREAAEVMGCSLAIARGHWDFARAWLHRRLAGGEAGHSDVKIPD